MKKSELIVAMCSFVGALVGVYAGSRLDQANWETRFDLEQKRVLLEKRVATIERVTVVINKAPLMKGLQGSLEAERDLAKLAVFCETKGGAAVRGCKSKPSSDMRHVETIGREIYALNSEMAAAMSLAAVYFGARTRSEIAGLSKTGVWAATDQQRQRLIDAMGAELDPNQNK